MICPFLSMAVKVVNTHENYQVYGGKWCGKWWLKPSGFCWGLFHGGLSGDGRTGQGANEMGYEWIEGIVYWYVVMVSLGGTHIIPYHMLESGLIWVNVVISLWSSNIICEYHSTKMGSYENPMEYGRHQNLASKCRLVGIVGRYHKRISHGLSFGGLMIA